MFDGSRGTPHRSSPACLTLHPPTHQGPGRDTANRKAGPANAERKPLVTMATSQTPKKPAKNKPAKSKGKPPKRYTEAETLDQQIRGLQLHMEGHTDREVAAELGVALGTAQKRIADSIDNMRPHADFDRYRARHTYDNELARRPLRKIIREWEPTTLVEVPVGAMGLTVTVKESNIDELIKAVTALMKVNEREAKLLLLDKTPVGGNTIGELSDEDLTRLVSSQISEVMTQSQVGAMLEQLEAHANN